MIVEAALVLVVALWQLGPSMAAGSGPRLAMDMLAGNSVTCDQGELVGIVEDVELLSIGHSKNVYRGVLKRRDSTVALPVVLKEYRITRRRTEAEVEAPSTGTLRELWTRAPRLNAAFHAHTAHSASSLRTVDAAAFLHHDAHGNLATAWSDERLDVEIGILYANYDADVSGSLETLEVARWLFDRLYTQQNEPAVRFRRACEMQLLQRYARRSSGSGNSVGNVFPTFYGRCTENTFIEERVETVFSLSERHRKQLSAESLVELVQRAARLERESHLTFLTDLNEHNFGFRIPRNGMMPAPVILDASYCAEDSGETFRLPQFCDAVRRMIPEMQAPSQSTQEVSVVGVGGEEAQELECLVWNLASIFPHARQVPSGVSAGGS
jgi:hypothetical protein